MVLTGLAVGVALGFAMQRGRFCVTGAFRDVWVNRSTRWLTAFLVVIAVQSVGIFALDALGVITLGAGNLAPVATIVGGFIFGFAIVLARSEERRVGKEGTCRSAWESVEDKKKNRDALETTTWRLLEDI